jgi:hypothetical protein
MKEYVQSRLSTPLRSGIYRVKFYTSRSKYNWAVIKKLCAYFSSNPLIADTVLPAFINNSMVFSQQFLTDTADYYGYGGWQEISGTLIVPKDSTYNYITIGNFQTDQEFWNDKDTINPIEDSDTWGIYYFVDNITIEKIAENTDGCYCASGLYTLNTTPIFDSLGNKCCYKYSFYYPSKTCDDCIVCQVSKFQIIRNEDTLCTMYPDSGIFFPPDFTSEGIFCIDKFSSNLETDSIFVLFYTKDTTGNVPLLGCEYDDFDINCMCDCSDLTDFPYLNDKLEFRLVKVDSSSAGKCCWDLIVSNIDTTDSRACQYDLSSLYLLMKSDSLPINMYNFSSNIGNNGIIDPNTKYWQAPAEFFVKPGNSFTIGQICSEGVQPQEVTIDLIFSNTTDTSDICKKVMTKTLQCEAPPQFCCDLISLGHHPAVPPGDGVVASVGYSPYPPDYGYLQCTYPFTLEFKNSMEFCDYPDTLLVTLYNHSDPTNILDTKVFTLKDLYNNPILIQRIAVDTGSAIFCVDIHNMRTNEHCIKCDSIYCKNIYMQKINIDDRTSLPKDNIDFINVIPNAAEDNFTIVFKSNQKDYICIATLYNNLSQSITKKSIPVEKGTNTIIFSTTWLSTGVYYITLNLNDKIMSKMIIINK